MKKNHNITIFSLLFLLPISFISAEEYKFGLGSCIHQDDPQPIWNSVKKDDINSFIFLGDNVYGDSASLRLDKMAKAYAKQKKVFPLWLKEKEVLAIWDDHDYGKNDGGGEYRLKKEAQKLFVDFWDIPKNDIRQTREGIYFNLIKNVDNLKINIIGLDTRYFRSELKGPKGNYIDNKDLDASMLGDAQWKWLSMVINTESDLVVLLTSIQLLATEHQYEKWSNFSLERNKLISLIQASGKQVIVISGDRHRGGIYKYKNIYELTASSMNKTASPVFETDSLLIGETHFEENYGIMTINTSDKLIKLILKDKDGAVLESITTPISGH
ncbi:alkaline phosphatase family protein [Gammaproteobacteria bacterium]|nr:alkaline phosphatase family protein [Gammaproteobacteria bacterium]